MKTANAKQALVHHLLETSARRFPEKTAVMHDDRHVSFSDINQQANKLARWLAGNGIEAGDRVALLFENSIEYVICYYGILKTGATVTPLNTEISPDQLKAFLDAIESKALIASRRFERLLRHSSEYGDYLEHLIIDRPKLDWSAASVQPSSLHTILEQVTDSDDLGLDIETEALASIIFTSGSTGTPKGVMLSHGNIVANVKSICSYLRLTERDIQMVVLPFHYVMGKSLLNTHIAVGGKIVINNKFAYPATVINQMVSLGVTGFSGVPSTYAFLLYRSPLKSMASSLKTLRYCSQAGGHMSEHLKRELRAALPEWTQIYIMYGATEASARLSYLDPQYFETKMGSIGKAIPGVSMKIFDKSGKPLPPNQIGEVTAQGPNIMLGYWQDREATAAVLDQNGYHTGDIGYADEDGFFYVTGRRDSLLKVSGHRINPQEIEDLLISTGLLAEAAVIGLPDELTGNRLAALITPKDDEVSLEGLNRFCGNHLPAYKRPASIQMVRSLPKKSSGKIDKQKCIEILKR
jgi:acyl-CoA synthetase (AMP-forming)/AMP-acid ligase II